MLLTISMIVMGNQPLVVPCLESIYAQTSIDCEIFLVNNLASPDLIQQISKQFPQVKIIHNSRRLSFAANNNQVMRRSNGQFILLLNDDTLILDHALDQMVDFMLAQPSDVGIAGCTNLDAQRNFTLTCFPFLTAKRVIWQHIKLGRWFPGLFNEEYLFRARGKDPFSADWVQGSCMLIRREVIDKVGYLDENFFLYSEEVDYCYRALQAGFSTYQFPQARIIHYGSVSTNRAIPIKIRGGYLSTLYFFAKHDLNHDLRLIRPWFVAELLAKSAARGAGILTGYPPDAGERLKAYLELIRLCVTYRGQPALELINWE
ncbi:MAG: glycosyltransferase family 2 protein [Chloroflexi bacterium]|nr:MAG: glycosyltransferase family 2 protein [Chloroflexota bacterium]